MTRKKILVIGSGFAGLSAAALLAKDGFQVTVLEKNEQAGGKARIWEKDGFTFDMGPSWYWMPDVFNDFFKRFGYTSADFYKLIRLDPSYRVFFSGDEQIDLPADLHALESLFETLEKGSTEKLREFLKLAKYKYEVGMKEYVFKPSASLFEFMNLNLIRKSFSMQLFESMAAHVRHYFKDPRLIKIMEFPVLFLGATPEKIPALYSLMNYADIALGTWYPMGGMNGIVKALLRICQENGVIIKTSAEVTHIEASGNQAQNVHTATEIYSTDFVIAGSDYEHTDQMLLEDGYRNYDEKYWSKKTLSPSCLIFYLGISGEPGGLSHHNLFFDEDFQLHAEEIYTMPQWPSKPLFYICNPSVSDPSVAPPGCTNLFILIPVAPGLKDTENTREHYFKMILERIRRIAGITISPESILVKRSYAINDFILDYHAFKGNAYGLANTLNQTAVLKPKMHSSKLRNLLYTGQLTVPGPGVPPSLISGQVAAAETLKYFMKNSN